MTAPKYQPWHKFHLLKGQSVEPLSPCWGVGGCSLLWSQSWRTSSLILSWIYLHTFFLPSPCCSWGKSWMQSRKFEENKEQGLWIKTYLGSNLSPALFWLWHPGSGRYSLWGLRICSIEYHGIVCRIVVGWLKEEAPISFLHTPERLPIAKTHKSLCARWGYITLSGSTFILYYFLKLISGQWLRSQPFLKIQRLLLPKSNSSSSSCSGRSRRLPLLKKGN